MSLCFTAGKVHTSEVTRNLLASLGGFQMDENLDLAVKVPTKIYIIIINRKIYSIIINRLTN